MKLPLIDIDTADHSQLKKLFHQLMAAGVTLLVLLVICGAFVLCHMDRMVEQLEMKSYDLRNQVKLGSSDKRPSPDVLILQFDDSSLNVLSDEFGVWPWPRDVHARMMAYLNRVGVRSLLYDIMFVSHRKGSEAEDQMMIDAFKRYNNVYLSMNFDNELVESQKLGKDMTPRDIALMQPFAIPLRSELNLAPKNTPLKLKRDKDGTVFFDNTHMSFNHYRSIMSELLTKGSNIGIINHGADEDGVSRGNPLFFRFTYQAFIKTPHRPLTRQPDGRWTDATGAETDADGYLYAKSAYLPVIKQKDGAYRDKNPNYAQLTDANGYLLDNYGNHLYQREAKLTTRFFPYLGLRAVLDLKFPHKTPEMLLTRDGHLKFANYDIPLNSNGDFLVNWYNVNVNMEENRKGVALLSAQSAQLAEAIAQMEAESKTLAAGSAAQQKLLTEMAPYKRELQNNLNVQQTLQATLNSDYTPQPYLMVSAWKVVNTMKKVEAGLPLDHEDIELQKLLKNKVIFVGATAVAAYDIKNTSIHPTMPGVVLQANLFDNLNQNKGKYLERVDPEVNIAITVLICLLTAAGTIKMRSALAGLLTAANIAVFYMLLAILLFQSMHLWINIAMPLVALLVTTTTTFMLKYFLRNKDYEKTYALATTDSMTGLYNHRFFQDHMRLSIEQANRFKHKFSLVLIDIDFFKKFNDTYGHQAGDEVLRQVAKKLRKNVRTVDIVARYGGEEMAIILDKANEEEALIVAQKIVLAIADEAYPIAKGVAKHVTISCGVATYPTHGNTPSQLIEFSDNGLYRAKENGRNQVGAQYDAPTPPGGGQKADAHGDHHAA